MKTFLAQNQFNSDSADAAECEAVAYASPPSTATANLSDGAGAKPILAFVPSEAATVSGREPVAAELLICGVCGHNPITQALEVRPALPVSSEPSLPAVSNSPAQETAGSFENELTHLIGVAGKRRRKPLALPPFAPDFPALWKAMHDKTAPRVELDPLWTDASPLFLKG